MEMGKVGAVRSEINVTPLVDVCLVLLIIFIVVQPMAQVGYSVNVPPKANATVSTPPPDQLVVSVTSDGKVFLNKEEMSRESLSLRLGDILRNRREKVVFFSVDDKANYGDAMTVMDRVRNCTGPEEDASAGVKVGIVLDAVPVR